MESSIEARFGHSVQTISTKMDWVVTWTSADLLTFSKLPQTAEKRGGKKKKNLDFNGIQLHLGNEDQEIRDEEECPSDIK